MFYTNIGMILLLSLCFLVNSSAKSSALSLYFINIESYIIPKSIVILSKILSSSSLIVIER